MESKEEKILVKRLDEYGFDPEFLRAVSPYLKYLATKFFRIRAIWDAPLNQERVIFCSNHEGFLPLDALLLKTIIDPCLPNSSVRPLLEDYIFTLPWIGVWASRLGCVRASQEHAVRLLEKGYSILAFPEGVKGAAKTIFTRGRIERFGRGGVVRLASKMKLKVIPIGISGIDYAYPVLFKLVGLGRLLGLPFIPVTPFFPLFGLFGLFPVPVRCSVVIGEMIDVEKMVEREGMDDLAILKINEVIRGKVGELVARAQRISSSI